MPIDARIGARLRWRRKLLGLSLNDIAPVLDVTYQTLQKYEKGFGRIPAARLYKLCRLYQTDFTHFFDDLHVNEPSDAGEVELASV